MTNELSVEEAIKVIDELKRNTDMFDDLYLALNMAIQALEKTLKKNLSKLIQGMEWGTNITISIVLPVMRF